MLGFYLIAWFSRPQTAADFYELALRHLHVREYHQAVTDLSIALMLLESSESPQAQAMVLSARCLAYNNLHQHHLALDDASAALVRIKNNPFFGLGLHVDFPSQGATYPSFMTASDLRAMRANSYLYLGNSDRAVEELESVLRDYPSHELALQLMEISDQ
jgi:tetratricopeptide (TPR) repeat protein